jgi:hypothetical protein
LTFATTVSCAVGLLQQQGTDHLQPAVCCTIATTVSCAVGLSQQQRTHQLQPAVCCTFGSAVSCTIDLLLGQGTTQLQPAVWCTYTTTVSYAVGLPQQQGTYHPQPAHHFRHACFMHCKSAITRFGQTRIGIYTVYMTGIYGDSPAIKTIYRYTVYIWF